MFDWSSTQFAPTATNLSPGSTAATSVLSEPDTELLRRFGTRQDAQCLSLASAFPSNPMLAKNLEFGVQRAAMRAQPVIDSDLRPFLNNFPAVGELPPPEVGEAVVPLGQLPTGEPLLMPVNRFAGMNLISGPTGGAKTSYLKYVLWNLMKLNVGEDS